MKWLMEWGVKKWLLGIVNTAIAKYNANITVARGYVSAACHKVRAVVAFLEQIDAAMADGKITEEEADQMCDKAVELAKELCN